MADGLRITRTLSIPYDELTWRFSASSGPGGQHANTSNTRAEVRFDVAGSPSLGPRQRARLLEVLGAEVRVAAQDERSQSRNRALALERLGDRIAEALHVERPRTATRPSRAAKRRRLDAKAKQGRLKSERGRRFGPDD